MYIVSPNHLQRIGIFPFLYKSSSPEVAMAADNNIIMLCDEAPMHCYLDMTRGLVLGIQHIIRQHVVDNR